MDDRGGRVEKTGKVGRLNILRQQIILPGEVLMPSVEGEVRMTPMRERESVPIDARVEAFVSPLRWLWEDFPQYLKEGPATALTPPIVVHTGGLTNDLGVAAQGGNTTMHRWFHDHPLRIYNEWFKWPEDPDIASWPKEGGGKLINLPIAWTRLQANDGPQDADYQVQTDGSGNDQVIDVRTMAEMQARYRQAVDRDWLAHDRYVDLLKTMWHAGGSAEVDKVPRRLRPGRGNVRPRNLWATNSDGLGQVSSIYDFRLDHNWKKVVMPEHAIVTYCLAVRFRPVAEEEGNPMAFPFDRTWAEITGHAGMLAAMRPQAVRERNFTGNPNSTNILGYLPAAWEWRTRWNHIGRRIQARDSFPLVQNLSEANSAAELRDATRINDAFLSQSLGDYTVDCNFSERVHSAIPGAMSSLYSGVGNAGRGSSEPYPGPRRVK